MEHRLGLNDLCNQSTKQSQRNCPLADLSDAAGALRAQFIVVVFAAFSVVVAAWAAADVDVFAAHWTCTFVTPYRVLLDDRRCDHSTQKGQMPFDLVLMMVSLQRTHRDSGGSALRAIIGCAKACAALPFVATDRLFGIKAFSPVHLIFLRGSHEQSPVRQCR